MGMKSKLLREINLLLLQKFKIELCYQFLTYQYNLENVFCLMK